MSNNEVFENIFKHFKSEEDDIDDQEFSQKSIKDIKHQSSTNVMDDLENKINENFSNNPKKKKPRRDKFGYFINNDNEDNEENENSLNSYEKNNSNDYYGNIDSEEENNENLENEDKDILGKNFNNKKNSLNYNDDNNKFIGDDLYKHIYEDKDEQDKNENNNHENLNSLEEDEFRMDSFRPKPMPASPQFINNKINNNDNENKNPNNNNYSNFTETLNTKIEGDNLIKNTNESINDKNIHNSIYNHNSNILSLGKLPNKDIINNEFNNKNNIKNSENERKNSEDSERRKEEDFLMMEEFKRKKYKEKLEQEKNMEQNKNIVDENNDTEDGRENVIDDEEEEENAQIQYLKNLEEKKKKIKKFKEDLKYNQNIKNNNDNINNNPLNLNNSINNINYNTNSNKIKDMPIKLLHQYINEESNKKEIKHNIENNKIENKNENNKIDNKNENNIINTNENNNININENNNTNQNTNINNNQNINININVNNNKPKEKGKIKYNISNKKNNKKIFKKSNIKKTEIKKFRSPPSSKTKDNNNYNSNKNLSVSSFNINSIKINNPKNPTTNKDSTRKNINKRDLNKIKRKLYSEKNEEKAKLKKQKTLPFLKSPPRHRPKKAVDYHEKYTFTPIINKKSNKIWEKRNKNIEKNMTPEEKKTNDNINDSSTQRNNKYSTPIGILLYEDANNKKEKMKQICLTEDNKIKLKSNITKRKKNSYNMVIERTNKKINNIINKHSTNEKLSILNIIQCLSDLNIINEIVKNNNINELSIEKFKSIIKNIKERDKKKLEELELIEQIWFKLNPTNEEYINNQIFFEFLKILFSCDYSELNNNKINGLTTLIEIIIEKYNDNDDNFDKKELYISPLRDKNFEEKDIWTITNLIKIFLKLKNDIKVYRSNDYEIKKKEIFNNVNEENEKELTFEPDLSMSNYVFDKNSKYYYYNNKEKDFLNQTISNNSSKPKHDFNRTYERFMQEKKMHEKVLEKLREIKKKKELKKYTPKPKIHDYTPKNTRKKSNLYNQQSEVLNKGKKIPIYEKLYSMKKNYSGKKSERKSKSEIFNNKEIKKNKDKILYKDKIENNKKKIQPFNVNNSKENKNNLKNIKSNLNKTIIDSIYITIEIKMPNGELKPLIIYKDQNNTIDLINEFCEENHITDEDRKIIFNKVIQYKNAFFEKSLNEEKNDYNPNNNEDMDTIANTYGNLSKNSNESNKKINNKNNPKINEKYKMSNEININQINKLKTVDDYITYKNQ